MKHISIVAPVGGVLLPGIEIPRHVFTEVKRFFYQPG